MISPQRRIVSLSLTSKHNRFKQFHSLFNLEEFTNIKELRLISLSANDAKELLDIIPKLQCNLTSLKIIFSVGQERFYGQKLREMILCGQTMSSLKRCVLTFYDNFVQKLSNSSTSNIEYLDIGNILIQDLIKLFQYLPKLRRLYAFSETHFRHYPVYSEHLIPFVLLPALTCLKLSYFVGLSNIEILLKHIPNLKYLKVTVYDRELVSGLRWEQMINQYLPLLRRFILRLTVLEYKQEVLLDIILKNYVSLVYHRMMLPITK
ncbi:unnamed protein product [Didymodactylos carnosus]|uniref:Uncharacterized protein n=1 Tax=Didymodactylos carnosus TaxID=1234261 RepID=A0A815VF18_9BILA|nr:unnamed protein product [Didymodactylos carnosus]CAF1528195.1 unnamed protein product [Didymodactylos carnosus]CAF4192805.1 unnamed protein product [Didymodactylos carnosus]CAF4387343.1 unnamed protein product [Didymodactylos carnosus]